MAENMNAEGLDVDRTIDDTPTMGVGSYHVRVLNGGEHWGKKKDQIGHEFVCLSPGPFQGCIHRDHIAMNSKDIPRRKRIRLAVLLGHCTPEEIKAGTAVVDWDKPPVGKQLCINLIEDKWEDDDGNPRSTVKVNWPEDYYAVDSEACIAKYGTKLNEEELKKIGKASQGDEKSTPAEATESVEDLFA